MPANYTGPGTATDPVDLVKKILIWLLLQGWTQDMSQADGAGWRVHAHKGSGYINLRAYVNEGVWAGGVGQSGYGIAVYAGSGFSGAAAWNAQAGGPVGNGQTYTVGSAMRLPSGAIVASHFFDDGADNITVVIEATPGVNAHLGWGESAEAGAGTLRQTFFGSVNGYAASDGAAFPGTTLTAYCPFSNSDGTSGTSAFVKADVDSFTGKWLSVGANTSVVHGYTGHLAPSPVPGYAASPSGIPSYGNLIGRSTSSINQQPNLLPLHVFAVRDAGGYSLLTTIPGIFATNATTKGFANGSVYSIGGTNYMIFHNFAVFKGS